MLSALIKLELCNMYCRAHVQQRRAKVEAQPAQGRISHSPVVLSRDAAALGRTGLCNTSFMKHVRADQAVWQQKPRACLLTGRWQVGRSPAAAAQAGLTWKQARESFPSAPRTSVSWRRQAGSACKGLQQEHAAATAASLLLWISASLVGCSASCLRVDLLVCERSDDLGQEMVFMTYTVPRAGGSWLVIGADRLYCSTRVLLCHWQSLNTSRTGFQ